MRINLRSPMIPLSLLILIDHIGFGILFPILVPLFMDGNGILGPDASEYIKSFWYNITLSIFPITLFFGATILGSLSDQYGRKKVLIICLLGAILSYGLAGVAIELKNLYLLVFSRFIAGLTAGSMPIAQAAIIDISNEKNKSSNLGLIIFTASLGFLLGPMLGGVFANKDLVSWFSYSTPFFVASLLAFFNLLFLKYFFQETYIPKKSSKNKIFDWRECIELTTAPFKMKSLRFLSLIFFSIQLGWGFYFQFVSIYLLKQYEFSTNEISIFMTLLGVGFALGSCFGIKLFTRYFKETTAAILALFIMVPVSMLTLLNIHSHLNYVSGLLMGICMAILYSLIVKFYSMTVSADKQGWVMGVSEAVISVAFAVTPLLSIYLENLELGLPLQIATFLFAVGTFLLLFWKEPKEENQENGITDHL